ncbi:SDR family NAD(P)-dependent oxidoreductase [Spirillospora sp. NPDC029432]|uniref:SDR family NAD(P)-dependent oxidoreductase n=1 Tax=Spirillospora sp. NPDC029432 TaxID=3154599 RepID=UPI00345179FE
MTAGTDSRDSGAPGGAGGRPVPQIIGIGPFGRPAPHLAVAVARAGGLGVLDLGTDRAAALTALADACRWWAGPLAVRVPAGCGLRPRDLPAAVGTVIVDAAALAPEPEPTPRTVPPTPSTETPAAPAPAAAAPLPERVPEPAAEPEWDRDGGEEAGWSVRVIPPKPKKAPAPPKDAAHLDDAAPEPEPVRPPDGDGEDGETDETDETDEAPEGGLVDAEAFARGRRLLIEVVDPDEAAAAVRRFGGTAGGCLHGIIARGREGAGRVGDLTTFVLLQRLLGDARVGVPVWAAGGIGPHTAAAAVAGGAAGVVLDSQLALVRELDAPADIAAAVAAMDGGETRIVRGHRLYARPDLPDFDLDGLGIAEVNAALGAAGGLRDRPVAVGQDGAFARPLAERYGTAGGVVQAVREQIAAHIRAAVRAEPLAPRDLPAGAAAARAYPVVQGPMTRVSDRAAFAAAVAQDGGLPFLALSLMNGEEARELLADTAARLADRPWGAGILGFAPPELRAAQLDAVRAARPPYALIAGGRPAQARPLEDAGISTYLHVPSPGLLDRFLAEGARKFVFEGMECGGHVGPRGSFPLWEAQVERLLAFCDAGGDGDAGELSIMFAGGIHDERSAAMVAALAGPLAERGAEIRVLMGTAYLFTYEAVEAGAITPGFQRAAVDCAGTALLETSPGHATRCARTPYVETFEAERRRLEEAGTPREKAWRVLEELNLGRLRVASKGLRREHADEPRTDGHGLVPVGADEQLREGMYMLGQVAALRSATTSVTGLHEQVSTGATFFLATRAAKLGLIASATGPAAPEDAAGPMDIAIVGIGCVFPQAPDAAAFWGNVVRGVDAVTEVPPGRWDPAVYFDPAAVRDGAGDRTPSKWGGFLPDVPFDALEYGIPPQSLAGVEPVQLLSLEVAARALEDAGYGTRPFDRSRTSVFFGAEAGTDLGTAYGTRALLPSYYGEVPPGLDEQLPRLTEDSCPGVLTNVIAGRIADRLDLGGANYTVDAACAASLAALDAACKELVSGGSDMVLCGGADLHNSIYDYLLFSAVHALSPRGRCAAFDASSDGIALGEGVGCVVLKRLADAERDGDRIYAVVKSVAGASDGRSAGITAPRAEGQRRALDRAYRRAGVSPARVGLVEAHGTGTELGDRTELATLTATYAAAGARPGGTALGSVKSQIGHTKCAAGLAGLIKTAYALHTGVRPGTLHLEEPNRAWDAATSPFHFGRSARPWAAAPGERYAGLSAFGFGGANFHAVLSGYDGAPEPVSGVAEWPAELFLIRGAGRAEARAELDRLGALLDSAAARGARLRDLAAAMAGDGSGTGTVQVALVATGLDDLAAKLAAARDLRAGPGVFVADEEHAAPGGRVAFLYPGQGSQRPDMLAGLFVAFPRLQRLLRLGGGVYADAMFPPAAFTPEEAERQRLALTDTRVAQPALGIAGLAAHRLLGELGVRPDMAAGHSHGELTALCAAGAFGEEDLVALSAARAEAVLAAAERAGERGGMAAVAARPEDVRLTLADVGEVVIANHNAPRQVVISGTEAGLAQALEILGEHGIATRRLPVACAFHSPLVAAAATALRAELDARAVRPPAYPVWSNAGAVPYGTSPAELRGTLAAQVAAPVRFAEQIEAMYAAGARVFVEAGPGRVLTRLTGMILGGRPHTAVAVDAPGRDGAGGVEGLLLALAELAVAGVPVDAARLLAGRGARAAAAGAEDGSGDGAAPPVPVWIVNGHLVRTADGAPLPNGLRPAERIAPPAAAETVHGTADFPAPARTPRPARPRPQRAGSAAEGTVVEFLRAGREIIAAQREVVLDYLGAGPGARRAPVPPEGAPPVPGPRRALPGEVVSAQAPAPALDPATEPATEPAPDAVSEPAPEAAPEPVPDRDRIEAAVLGVISARTGYPREMLAPGLDLEADLSIDSIKRTEILGELADRFGQGRAGARPDGAFAERLAAVRTIGELVGRLGEHLAAPDERPAVQRYLVETVPLPQLPESPEPTGPAGEPAADRFAGRAFVIVDDGGGIALELADLLERRGAQVRTPTEPDGGPCDGLIHLAALRPGGGPVLPGAYGGIRDALAAGGLRWLVLASGSSGTFGRGYDGSGAGDPTPGAGLRGLARTLALEYPRVLVRALDVDTKDTPRAVALRILAELAAAGNGTPVEVGHFDGARYTLTTVPADPPGPDGDDIDLGLDAAGVVLLTGGGRGITARTAVELARRTGCHVELIGRTPPPHPDPGHDPVPDPALAAAADEAALRRALVARGGGRTPAEIEALIRRILADREVRATLDALAGHAASVRYTRVDVRDAQAVRAAVEDVYARHGRLDGVVHGAGVVDDRLVRDKDPASFARVYRTKVDGARALAAAVRPDLGFFVVFGSVAGVQGNRGQADYAAANDACDTLAHVWRTQLRGRVLVADWGPWDGGGGGGGMVTPELAREYARRGIPLIDPDAGVAALLREIAYGGELQAVFTGTP